MKFKSYKKRNKIIKQYEGKYCIKIMNNLCCICLGHVKDKSFLQKCFDIKKTCKCQFFMHNSCFCNYIDHSIRQKKDIECILCKSKIVTYKTCIKKTKKVHIYISNFIENLILLMKVLAIAVITTTFIQLLRVSFTST